ncbi:right-handed parallel beta-helix repeat-containing protein [Synoicihabitans lomoniglobus]|uniref:Right-handed parallel beta-helix repeat-containing protein n=1 Tax=Synoicihabitans lomoniglobus TaxID=2909285 RepID=A0AAE9ZTX1_9BACT|nr:right-handed parallel beta-helix repeat-containing protein [Opitutaceae bacterium LMO-M01]WED64201.1 right-handed parallel beta-helix repeat-containing protein [Opitutaceae bacterium LMO-M01]
MKPPRSLRHFTRLLLLFASGFFTSAGFAADITLTAAMLNDYHLGGGIVDFADATIGYPPNDVPNNLAPGDTIYIEAHTRKFIRIKNLTQGTAANPITITNTGGQFILEAPSPTDATSKGIGLLGVQHVILKGTPDPGNYDYGIKIASTKNGATGIKIGHNGQTGEDFVGSFDVEVTGIEIGNTGFAGIQAKCEIAAADLPEEGYIMEDIHIHHNYIHDVHGEGLYIGWTSSGHHDMGNVTINDNLIVNAGWDGIQLTTCREGGLIYNNIILGYGVNSYTAEENNIPYYWQNSGIGVSGSTLDIHHNWVQAVSEYAGAAVSVSTYGDTTVTNNVLIGGDFSSDPAEDGIYISEGSTPPMGATITIANNTVIEPERDGIHITNTVSLPVAFTNNIVAHPITGGYAVDNTGTALTATTNLYTATVAAAGFVDASSDDYHLASGSAAIDTGTDTSAAGVTDDFDTLPRPEGAAYDIGAFEREADITLTIITPDAWGTASGSGFCSAATAFNEQPTWDAANLIPVGDAASPHAGTKTAYTNRHWYMDFGADYANVRIVAMWTRYRPSSPGSFSGFDGMWWDNDNDNVNDGTTATGMNFGTAQDMPSTSEQLWVQDADFSGAPITPPSRYLLVSTGSTPTDRGNEFAFVGYIVP